MITRLKRAADIYSIEEATRQGIKLIYVNTSKHENPEEYLRSLTGGNGFNDCDVFAPVAPLVEQADRLLGHDGCLNFFVGPQQIRVSQQNQFLQCPLRCDHVVGTSGGNTADMVEINWTMMSEIFVILATDGHAIRRLNSVPETTLQSAEDSGREKADLYNISLRSPRSLIRKTAGRRIRYSGNWRLSATQIKGFGPPGRTVTC